MSFRCRLQAPFWHGAWRPSPDRLPLQTAVTYDSRRCRKKGPLTCRFGGVGGTAATVSGTVAAGAAIAGGTITLKCAVGSAPVVTTRTDGSFTVDVSAVTLPRVGRVDYRDAGGAAHKLQTFVKSAGIANITPLTQLLLANLTGAAADNAFDNFSVAAVQG